ncbi:hypothetical protein BESB_009320 [Besnoitia besnoiti]|uniref:Uncharacterized protein n=1 Tax=Besnoitia besnoiti TaxID=94643 RepID=A0A2A9MQX1_BESBE|nr:hypothetical protein BESB_009320 [Besnoitia besnoiti]PFH38590.1 hypothetical protein BESB_009320 [Besnoitia besnoiti]
MELLTSFIDEANCNNCFGNLIVISAACIALDAMDKKAGVGAVLPDNLVMVLDVITFALRKMHTKCYDNVRVYRKNCTQANYDVLQTNKLLDDPSCKPIARAQITGIHLAIERLARQSSTLALQGNLASKASRTRLLRTLAGFWKVQMPLALKRMSDTAV